MFQMQIYIIVVLLLYCGAVSGGLQEVLRLAEFIADIYQQFPHSCIFLINSEAQQQGED
jgi:ribose/xylose/arabinose/galactoside ABC-type transport system permease subunit